MAKHIVVGAGPVGTATARLLAERGEDVVVVTRSGSGPEHPRITRTAADAAAADRLTELARDAVAIHGCAGLPYQRWVADWPPLTASLLTAAERTGAVLAMVSNLYAYGPVDGEMTEDLPLLAPGPKGRVRARMWTEALAAHDAGRVRVTEVRPSDYACAGPNSALGRVAARALAGRPVRVLRSADTPHTWTSPQDVARLLATVVTDERAWGRPWHVPSAAPRTQREAVADLCQAGGVEPVVVREYAPAAMRALGLVMPVIREVGEVVYQFERPFVMDSTAAQTTFGLAPTPWADTMAGIAAPPAPDLTPSGASRR